MIIEAVLVMLVAACALLAVSGLALTARTKGAWREPASWCGPLAFTSAAIVLLAAAGALGALAGVLLALAPLAVLTVMLVPAWRDVAREKGAATATLAILARVGGRLRDALWNAREDARDLSGKLRRDPAPAVAPAPGAPPRGAGPKPPAARQVPPLRASAASGSVPSAPEVAAGLHAVGAVVPPEAAAFADMIGNFDPDEDEDEMLGFVAANAAGFLVISEAYQDLVETLLTGAGLDVDYAMGFIDISNEVAGLAEAFALLDRRYHEVYEDIHAHVDAGKTLPHNSRRYFHADGGAPEGGAAA